MFMIQLASTLKPQQSIITPTVKPAIRKTLHSALQHKSETLNYKLAVISDEFTALLSWEKIARRAKIFPALIKVMDDKVNLILQVLQDFLDLCLTTIIMPKSRIRTCRSLAMIIGIPSFKFCLVSWLNLFKFEKSLSSLIQHRLNQI